MELPSDALLCPTEPRFWETPGPRVMLAHPEHGLPDGLLDCLQASAPDDAVVFSSSGSTDAPKLTVLTRASLLRSARMVVDWLGLNENDILHCPLPLHHVGGFGVLARARTCGGRFIHDSSRWEPEAFKEGIEARGVTVTSLVPTQVFDLVHGKIPAPACLRIAVVGGGHLATDLESEARQLGWPLYASFGMTEASSQIATEIPGLRPPAPGWLPVIKGWETDTDNEGRLRLRGPALFSGRLLSRQPGQWGYIPANLDDGWFSTADYAEVDRRNSHVWIRPTGRSDDSIKIRGELVSLSRAQRELEGLARAHGLDPRQLAVIDVPDERAGSRLVLVSEEAIEPSVPRVLEAFNHRAPAYARLESRSVVKSIPRSPLGKVRRATLRELVAPSA